MRVQDALPESKPLREALVKSGIKRERILHELRILIEGFGVDEWLYVKNFTMENGLDPIFHSPYNVLNSKHPNVKIEKERERPLGVT